ncbi:MAG: hypothetical protein RLZZ455_333 [Candidatus Parcubacteria bacterium]|jgi:hypothetical protein
MVRGEHESSRRERLFGRFSGFRRLRPKEVRDLSAPIYHSPESLSENPESARRIEALERVVGENVNENVRGLLVFGSTVSGELTEESDTDYIVLKQDAVSTDGALDPDDVGVLVKLRYVPFPTHLGGSLSLNNLQSESMSMSNVMFLFYFGTPQQLGQLGAHAHGMRNPERSFITDWTVIARTREEGAEIAQVIEQKASALGSKS